MAAVIAIAEEDTMYSPAGRDSLGLRAPVVVLGLGATGLSCARFLCSRGYPVTVADENEQPEGLDALLRDHPELETRLGPFDAHWLGAAGTLVVSPGVALTQPAVAAAMAAGADVLGDIELFARAAVAPVIAVTGSNGKSTVTSLIARMVQSAGHTVAAGGNLSPPALALLDQPVPDYYVLELSSFQLETTRSLEPAVATVLNLSSDHMDRYPDFDAYAAAKQRIFAGSGVQVVNLDDPRALALAGPQRESAHVLRRRVGFTLGQPGEGDFGVRTVQGNDWLAQGHTLLARVDAVPLPGAHNVANALAALAMGEALGLSMVAMIGGLLDFKGLPHRCEQVAHTDGVRWYNDSKGTNVGATCAAIDGLGDQLTAGGKLVLIAGGEGKGADFSPLAASCAGGVRLAVLFGRDARDIGAVLADHTPVEYAADLSACVAVARAAAKPGDAVLFSPACASFDMFRNYEERGRAFTSLVSAALTS